MQGNDKGGAEARYQAQLNEGRFLIQRCSDCNHHVFFPRVVCPHCGSAALAWVEPKGTGVVYSTTTVRRKPDLGGDYDVSLVELDEGVRMMSRVDGVPPTDVKIGMRVRAKVVDDKGVGMVVFTAEDAK
ncbi:MAG: DNA-binding protein [Betaproteobacteria bacterium RIFCSPLOWO2_02_FULL_63_19]|nr:MAG: DNA-binding protein [Betaproteobacteria bacterium RIFCSPLOWO2_02_FULL_63_19]